VFLLWHAREFSDGEDDEKLIGVYRTEGDICHCVSEGGLWNLKSESIVAGMLAPSLGSSSKNGVEWRYVLLPLQLTEYSKKHYL
jgi:hypothetical protein